MDDFDCVMTVGSTKSGSDSGFENGFLSDSSSSSGKSDGSPAATCVFEETTILKKHSHHRCSLDVYNISKRCIETLSPRTFLYLGNCVRVLDLSGNKIKVLPETLSDLENLQELNVSCNELVSVPNSCARLKKLKILNLSQNQLTEPPFCLELGMDVLTHLDLSRNSISNFPNPPKCSIKLQSLNLSRNCLKLLPLWMFDDQCRYLTDLDVSFNFCFDDSTLRTQLPLLKHHRTSVLKSLRKLKMCNTGSNQELASPLRCFECLQVLHLGNLEGNDSTHNHFIDLRLDLFYNPENIVELYLPKLGLSALPENIDKLRNLEVLDASYNKLDWLPETFGLLKLLRELVLADCSLAYLPNNFGQLKSLKKLVVPHNKLSDVQPVLGSLVCLEWLDLYDNHLEELAVSPDHLLNLHMVDMACNFVNLESALDLEINGENMYDFYCRQQTRLRKVSAALEPRIHGCKVGHISHSWDSLESLHKGYCSGSNSDLSQSEGNSFYQLSNFTAENKLEENWDEDSENEIDEFEPCSVHRYHLPLGQYQFGWTPPVKRRWQCQVPINQQVSGFVYVPGQMHQRTTVRKVRRRVKDLQVADGQFDDACVDHFADLQKAESLGALLRKLFMFVRNPAGLRSRRWCRFHSVYEDCFHHGVWFRLGPPVSFENPVPMEEEDDS